MKSTKLFVAASCNVDARKCGVALIRQDHNEGSLLNETRKSARYKTSSIHEGLLNAVIYGLQSVPEGSEITIITNNKSLHESFSKLLSRWRMNGWKKTDGKPITNKEQWKNLNALSENRTVQMACETKHVKGGLFDQTSELAKNAVSGKFENGVTSEEELNNAR
ncbi:hypothetical protein GCM10008927_19890 [Amylibacter ulvae]|uniref:RNase H type-1 domain-containing protein n=1 Tax=Paramylibacter ulvae TaxID=1651968 RepID=A0ABQ3D5M4_9RHOB|nr:RNase H family protein [Amylibacter ulvae]GHA53998.1 hypothetical protein GCM10008927_19890 [Amylibacter ulvae]